MAIGLRVRHHFMERLLVKSLILTVFLVARVDSFEPPSQVVQHFTELEYRYTGGRFENQLFRYRLHKPTMIDGAKLYPLILWFHGARERGNGNRAQLRWLDYVLEQLPPDRNDYFVLAVQSPPDAPYWYFTRASVTVDNGQGASDDMLRVAKTILDRTVSSFPIDENRIYLAGVSSGGTACWEMSMRYPGQFAAVAPMGSNGGDLLKLERIIDLPIWSFHSQADHPERVQRTVDGLRSVGGKAFLTIIESDPHDLSDWMHRHDCWSEAIRKYGVMNWLLRQRRGSPVIPPPGHEPWSWLHYSAFALAILGLFGGSWFLTNRAKSLWI